MIILKIIKTVPFILTLIIMIGLIAAGSVFRGNAPSGSSHIDKRNGAEKTSATVDTAKQNSEMRGVWVSYMELSMENEDDKSERAFRLKFDTIAKNSSDFGFNTLIVQVRPFCDALYKSKYFPYSHILTGTQGKNPGYDALQIMCEICRKYDLNIHAWVNPYRISSNNTPAKLSEDNPYSKDKSIGLKADNGLYLDPSSKAARELIINGVTEIAENYDVDGIQFDDYFYPTQDENFDTTQYEEYVDQNGKEHSMNLENWRKANVNMLICDTYRAVHKISDKIEFGISPQGNIDNNENIYADVKSWCECKGFADYICPQIYFSLDNPALSFEDALDSWQELDFAENVKLYVGLAGYKAGTEDDEGTWLESNNILADEYKIISADKKTDGFMLYSYACLENETAEKELENLKEQLD